ncbi:MAG: MBL fold metallo-hydrolase [Deltaproteobacteria bacterium]|nr:MBL fold metallo-hydrolase [Deltaproteobacteria bacterium]
MKVTFWGVRGSIPSPGASTHRYGGNTACLEVRGKEGECIILDAGTGIRALGLHLLKQGNPLPHMHLFISHTHWDHIQGFPFFMPCYFPGNRISIKGPVHYLETKNLKDIFDAQMQYDFFPISNQQLAADIDYDVLNETSLNIGTLRVTTQFSNHPIRSLMYRITEGDVSMVYTGDHEPYYNLFDSDSGGEDLEMDDDLLFGDMDQTVEEANSRFVAFIRGTDLLIADSQYTPDEYPEARRGWGHSSWDYCLDWMKQSGTKKMVLTHHDPNRSDDELDTVLERIHAGVIHMGIDPRDVTLAAEGMEMEI